MSVGSAHTNENTSWFTSCKKLKMGGSAHRLNLSWTETSDTPVLDSLDKGYSHM